MVELVPLDEWAEISGCADLLLTHYNIKQPAQGKRGRGWTYYYMEIVELVHSLTV